MMVVVVLMTSCQVSEKPRNGPDIAHITIDARAITKAKGVPKSSEVVVENFRNNFFICHIVDDDNKDYVRKLFLKICQKLTTKIREDPDSELSPNIKRYKRNCDSYKCSIFSRSNSSYMNE